MKIIIIEKQKNVALAHRPCCAITGQRHRQLNGG
uniref:Uncharacterized protein n=1 Tax=Anguilla anguilla TaxID=7936 RepID=A0A0E9PK84_ANGAN